MTDATSEYPPPRHLETLAVTAGRPPRVSGAALNPAVHLASTYIGSHLWADLAHGLDALG